MVGGGLLYLRLAYMPLPGPYSHFFGIGGGLITVLLVYIFIRWSEERNRLNEVEYNLLAFE
jgi:hypothetical protein